MARTKARTARQLTQPGGERRTPVSPDLAKRFVAEYLKDFNGTQAYLRASPGCKSDKAAATCGWQLLRNPEIQSAVAAGARRDIASRELSAARILEEMRRMALLDPADFFDKDGRLLPVHKMPVEARVCLTGMDVARANLDGTDGKRSPEWLHKIRYASKDKALEMLAKHFKLLDRAAESEQGDWDKLVARITAARARGDKLKLRKDTKR